MSGVNTGFATIAAEAFGLSPDEIRSSPPTRPRARTPVRAAAPRSRTPLALRCYGGRSRAREAPGGGVGGARDRTGRPRGSRRSRARGRRARSFDHGCGGLGEGAPLRRPLRADRGPRRLGTDERCPVGGGSPRACPGRPGHRDRAPRPCDRAGRRTYLNQPSSKARCAAVRPRASAGLFEELVHDESGQLLTGSFMDYAIPVAERVPDIDTLIVEVPAPEGPSARRGSGKHR